MEGLGEGQNQVSVKQMIARPRTREMTEMTRASLDTGGRLSSPGLSGLSLPAVGPLT